MNITMTREEVCNVLGVKESTLKDIIKAKRLDARLEQCGLHLVSKIKMGRNVVYEVNPIELDYWDKVQSHYHVKKKSEHDAYTIARLTDEGLMKSRSSLIKDNSIDISGSTAKRYDDILENEGIIMKGDMVYAIYNRSTGEFTQTDEDGYKSFWQEVAFCKELLYEERRKLNKRLISQSTYDSRIYSIVDSVGREKGQVAIKFDTYKELEDTVELIEMIRCKLKNRMK